jgi:hypothetical protein
VYPGERFLVGVFATTPTSEAGPSHFDIVATTTGSVPTALQNSIALPGVVSPQQYKQYRFDFASAATDLIIQVNVAQGGLDMFASETAGPSNTSFTWSNAGRGGILRDRYLYLPWANFSAKCQAIVLSGVPCPVYIAVQGWASMALPYQAVYTITGEVSGSTTNPLPLVDGFPVYTYVPANGYAYLSTRVFAPGGNSSLYISVTNFGGSTSLFVNLGVNKTFANLATSGSADFVSSDLGGYERVIIRPNPRRLLAAAGEAGGASSGAVALPPLGDDAYCTNCPLFVTVYGLTSCYVSVQYSTGPIAEALRDDVQVMRSAPAQGTGAAFFT